MGNQTKNNASVFQMAFMTIRPLFPASVITRADHETGFTILEILAVLVIIGILSAVAVSRFTGTDTAENAAAANTLKAHLRYAQLRAMGDIEPWGISFGGSSYTLFKMENGETDTVTLPGEDGPTKDNVSVSDTTTVTFSAALGRPDPENHIITIGSRSIVITAETGFIQ